MDNGKDSARGGNAPLRIDSGVIGGSTGGASSSDLARGYSRPDQSEASREDDIAMPLFPEPASPNGFLDRPSGWER